MEQKMQLSRRGLMGFMGAALVMSMANKAIAAPLAPSDTDKVRVLLDSIRENIQRCLNSQVFDQNAETSRAVVRDAVSRYMEGLYNAGHIWDYSVHCDSTNNLEHQWCGRREIDLDVYLIPTAATSYIHLDFTSATGQLPVSDILDEKQAYDAAFGKFEEYMHAKIAPEEQVTNWGIRP